MEKNRGGGVTRLSTKRACPISWMAVVGAGTTATNAKERLVGREALWFKHSKSGPMTAWMRGQGAKTKASLTLGTNRTS
jgi:hypothetical protein